MYYRIKLKSLKEDEYLLENTDKTVNDILKRARAIYNIHRSRLVVVDQSSLEKLNNKTLLVAGRTYIIKRIP